MQTTELMGLPYLEVGDHVEDIANQSKQFVTGVESVMLSNDFRGLPGDQGGPGPRGLPGINAVPADEAVAAYVAATDTSTHAALKATFGGYATESKNYIDTQDAATLAAAKTYTDGLVGNQVATMATKEMFVTPFVLTGPVDEIAKAYVVNLAYSANLTPITFPFPVQLVSLSLMQERKDIPLDMSNYIAVSWRKMKADKTFAVIADKRTNAGAWAARVPFSFDNETQNEANKTLAAGESVNIAFSRAGTGEALFPIYGTLRWRPL